jgi:hypothetical protein
MLLCTSALANMAPSYCSKHLEAFKVEFDRMLDHCIEPTRNRTRPKPRRTRRCSAAGALRHHERRPARPGTDASRPKSGSTTVGKRLMRSPLPRGFARCLISALAVIGSPGCGPSSDVRGRILAAAGQ